MKSNKLPFRGNLNFWSLQFIGWTFYGILFMYAESRMTAHASVSYRHIVAWFLSVMTGFAISLLLRYLYRNTYYKTQSILLLAFISVICSIAGSFLWLSVKDITELILKMRLPYSMWTKWGEPGFSDYIMVNVLLLSIPLFIWSFIYFSYKMIMDLSIEKSRSKEILLQAKEAQLQMLRYQINPHFLFNSLNSIQGLIYKDKKKADEMIGEFSEFLRYTLKNRDEMFVSLEEEFDMIRRYLYIEKIRFEEKLNFSIELAEETKSIKILSFLLQPFVENAIKHGFKLNQEVLFVVIRSFVSNNFLEIDIENCGKWVAQNTKGGIGITNVKNRLVNAYPNKHNLQINEENNWVKIKLLIELNDE